MAQVAIADEEATMTLAQPRFLVETDWLAAQLGEPDPRVLDCTVRFNVRGEGPRIASGRETWEQGHIPGSVFADILEDLVDRDASAPLMLPPPAQFAEAMARYGVSDGSRVVLYDACADEWAHMWAARVWWMLRVYGFEHVSVLNGGLFKWKLEGRPISTKPASYPPGQFTARYRPELVASKDEVLEAVGSEGTCLINALSAEAHRGEASMYPRPGRIASSVNVPTMSLIDPVTHAYLPSDQLRAEFARVRALDRERVVTYCGAGIAASSDALILSMLGAPSVAVYDGSLAEWTADPSLPMETD